MTICRCYVPHRQRGAIGLLGAIVMVLVVLCIALALDTGRLYMEQRNLQRIADLAALETLSRVELPGGAGVTELANAAAVRNGFDPEQEGASVLPELGRLRIEAGRREFDAGAGPEDSLRVTMTKDVPTSLITRLAGTSATTTLSARAVASRTGTAAFTLGTGLLDVDSTSSPLLGPLLGGMLSGSDLDLSLIDYRGLLDTRLTLLQLAEAMPLVGLTAASSMDELLDTELSVSRFAELMAKVLERRQADGELSDIDLDLLRLIEEEADLTLDDIRLGDLLALKVPSELREAALDTDLRLGDLLGVGLLAANGTQAIGLDISSGALGDGIDELGGALGLDVGVRVVEPPRLAIGPPGRREVPDGHRHWRTEVMSPQVSVSASTYLNLGLISLDLGLRLDAGSGKAALAELGADGTAEILAKPSLAALHLGDTDDLDDAFGSPPAPLSVKVLDAGDAALVDIRVSGSATGTGSGDLVIDESDVRLAFAPPYPNTRRAQAPPGDALSGLVSSLGDNLAIDVDILGSDDGDGTSCGLLGLGCIIDDIVDTVVKSVLEPIIALLLDVLAPLLDNIGAQVLGPLLELLGVDLNTLTVTVIDASSTRVELVK